jgi:hypothetical protein
MAIFAISSGEFRITPRNRTGAFLPASAMLMEMVALWTSIPINEVVCICLLLLSTGESKLAL